MAQLRQQEPGIWVDPANEGYQWVDGPASAASPMAVRGSPGPADQAQYQLGTSPCGFPPQQQAATPWVDSAVPPPTPPIQAASQQEMVFQWVDCPNYGRAAAPQHHYLQAPPAPLPYFPGMDSAYGAQRPLDMASAHAGLDLLRPPAAASLGYGAGAGSLDHYAHSQAAAVAAGQQYGQRGAMPMDDLSRLGPGGDRYGQAAAASYQLFNEHGGDRRRQMQAQRPQTGRPDHRDEGLYRDGQRGRGRGVGGSYHTADERGRPQRVQADSTARRHEETSMAAATMESMTPEALRTELVTTLESLYEDRIKPMANYVKGRLKERSCPENMVKSFVELYLQHPDLFIVQNPNGGDEATTLFVKEPVWFKGWVDIDSFEDPYDEHVWQEFAKFLDGEHTFAGGRYGMARELIHRKLPFFANYSLGEVCHIVQLAIQHRRLIVYHRKMLKPIQTVLCQMSPDAGPGSMDLPVEGEEIKDMDDLCAVLFRMLNHHPNGVRLCRMKQMIKHEFCRKLSEMAFQCTKLIELFSQEPLAQTFVLDTENDGKSIYVRMGDPNLFSDHVKRIYSSACALDSRQGIAAN